MAILADQVIKIRLVKDENAERVKLILDRVNELERASQESLGRADEYTLLLCSGDLRAELGKLRSVAPSYYGPILDCAENKLKRI